MTVEEIKALNEQARAYNKAREEKIWACNRAREDFNKKLEEYNRTYGTSFTMDTIEAEYAKQMELAEASALRLQEQMEVINNGGVLNSDTDGVHADTASVGDGSADVATDGAFGLEQSDGGVDLEKRLLGGRGTGETKFMSGVAQGVAQGVAHGVAQGAVGTKYDSDFFNTLFGGKQ